MNNKIPYTTYQGMASELCRKGDAVEFIQPWYSPISTTPENTGMAVGGIGNTFTLTPKGDTPNFSLIPGIFIDCSDEDIHFNDFYLSTMDVPSLELLELKDIAEAERYLRFYPAKFNGKAIDFPQCPDVLAEIKSSLAGGAFYADNAENFSRWQIEFSPKTRLQVERSPESIETQILVALDFFNGLLTNRSAHLLSLTSDKQNTPDDVNVIAGENVAYKALYPLAEYSYQGIDDIQVERKVVSPIVKEDKKLCSLPMHWNHFTLTNRSDETKLVTLVQPLQNLLGSTYRKGRDGIQDSACTLTQNPISQINRSVAISQPEAEFYGVKLASESPYVSDIEGEVIYGVQADKALLERGKVSVSVKSSVYSSKADEQLVYALKTGRTRDQFERGIYSGREGLTSLVCVQIELEPGEVTELRFVQVMDHSKIALNGWHSEKAYTQFYAQDNRAESILKETLPQLSNIEERITEQQEAYLQKASQQFINGDTAARFATMSMNTLSFLSESSVWDKQDKFLVKECVDYPFFNSLDVYFYGSFSLLYLLPELDACVMKAFADAILASDDTIRRYWEYDGSPNAELEDSRYEGVRAVRGAVIHDLGSPFDIQPDAYTWHNVKQWKDLAPKYVLMVYRQYQHSKDVGIVKACWPAVKESIEFLTDLIEEGDTIPLTRGTDDTFDNLSSHGVSIYCASLWAAGLKAAGELAKLVGEESLAVDFERRYDAARETVENSLWDEQKGYYHFFVTPVQAKHLTGKGYEPLNALGLSLTGDVIRDKAILNAFLDNTDTDCDLTMSEQRIIRKKQLAEFAPQAFTGEYHDLVTDSDNSFGDAMLADSYLRLMNLEGLLKKERVQRALDYIWQANFLENSPKLGVANMTLSDGAPHEAFQAQDVWIGVQFSVATALNLSGKNAQAERLMDTVYDALYQSAKIPFAAPEGFNCSVALTAGDLTDRFDISEAVAGDWLAMLKETGCLLPDNRVNPELSNNLELFGSKLEGNISSEIQPGLLKLLLNTGLKYTAGRYFRPGMIFAYMY